ncbi:dienelactone hydrolase family protein [Rhodoligotrophos defluvii]|uniref:dienelactone hydrolase family protein n=1 Tax=Rhodoligotrophos defluvii TaxID=2561934 RepID=UPI0010CA05A4|nr:dienelactone hydrolase family protein [Rhodoligotrophos defluvii]
MTLRNETLTYEADGLSMASQFYWDDGLAGRRPGILVFPEAFGLGEHAMSRAQRLAELGYATLACDLHGQGQALDDLEQARAAIAPLRPDPHRTRARARAALQALTARAEVNPTRIAAIGYCFGGTMALELARSGAPIAAAVGFHSGLATVAPQDARNITGKVLVCIGADDPGIPPEQRAAFEQEMREGGVDWRLHLYGGVVHSFTNPAADRLGRPDFARYDAGADARSWSEMLAVFNEVFPG